MAKKPKDLAPLLFDLVRRSRPCKAPRLRGLAEYDHPETVERILANLLDVRARTARQDALQTLASRPAWAMAMLDAVEANRIPRTDLTAFTARQLQNLGHAPLSARVQSLWGELRATPADKARQIAGFKRRLTPEALKQADRSAGRALFQKNCANCHKLFDAGGTIGPDITGAQRMNLDYLLENLIDPSAAVSRDFQMQVIQTTSGRVITGPGRRRERERRDDPDRQREDRRAAVGDRRAGHFARLDDARPHAGQARLRGGPRPDLLPFQPRPGPAAGERSTIARVTPQFADSLELFFGDANPAETRVYARLRWSGFSLRRSRRTSAWPAN